MNPMRFIHKLLIVFAAGIVFAFLLHFIPIANNKNPLLPQESLRDALIVWYYKKPVSDCLNQKDSRVVFNCVNAKLRAVARTYGARMALNVIEPISQNNPVLLALGHDLAHTIGNNALYASYGLGSGIKTMSENVLIEKMGKVIVDCDGWGSFGCYHGVIEVALSRIPPNERTGIIRRACLDNPLVMSRQYYLNQCMHWFGHAMAIFTDQTLEQTLAMCESVSPNFSSDEVQLCLSGVFHAGALPGTSDPGYLENVSRVYKKDDVYFPCLDVAERFRGHCFSHVVGRSHTGDVAIMMRNCDGIPEKDPEKRRLYVRGCYESIGNNLLITANFTAAGVAKECQADSAPEFSGFCYGGAARYSILRDPLLNNTLPFAICKLAPTVAKTTCYGLAGFANFENYKSRSILKTFCANAEEGYPTMCESLQP